MIKKESEGGLGTEIDKIFDEFDLCDTEKVIGIN